MSKDTAPNPQTLSPLDHLARGKILELMEEKGTKAQVLGAALAGENATKAAMSSKASRLLNGNAPLSLKDLYRVAKFYGKSPEYFITGETKKIGGDQVNSSHDNSQLDAKQYNAEQQTFTLSEEKGRMKAEGHDLEKMLGSNLSDEEKKKVQDFMGLLASRLLKK